MSTVPEMTEQVASLDAYLTRNLHWPHEGIALADRERFVEQIEKPFQALVKAEDWVQKFYDGRAAIEFLPEGDPESAFFYEFDVDEQTYVVLEERDEVVIVSQRGMVSVPRSEALRKVLRAPAPAAPEGPGHEARPSPKAFVVTQAGETRPVDIAAIVEALRHLQAKNIPLPKMTDPQWRLGKFSATQRQLTPEKAAKGLQSAGLTRLETWPELSAIPKTPQAPAAKPPPEVIVRPTALRPGAKQKEPAEPGPAQRGSAASGALKFWGELLPRLLNRQVTTTATEYAVKVGGVAHQVGKGEKLFQAKERAGTVVVRRPSALGPRRGSAAARGEVGGADPLLQLASSPEGMAVVPAREADAYEAGAWLDWATARAASGAAHAARPGRLAAVLPMRSIAAAPRDRGEFWVDPGPRMSLPRAAPGAPEPLMALADFRAAEANAWLRWVTTKAAMAPVRTSLPSRIVVSRTPHARLAAPPGGEGAAAPLRFPPKGAPHAHGAAPAQAAPAQAGQAPGAPPVAGPGEAAGEAPAPVERPLELKRLNLEAYRKAREAAASGEAPAVSMDAYAGHLVEIRGVDTDPIGSRRAVMPVTALKTLLAGIDQTMKFGAGVPAPAPLASRAEGLASEPALAAPAEERSLPIAAWVAPGGPGSAESAPPFLAAVGAPEAGAPPAAAPRRGLAAAQPGSPEAEAGWLDEYAVTIPVAAAQPGSPEAEAEARLVEARYVSQDLGRVLRVLPFPDESKIEVGPALGSALDTLLAARPVRPVHPEAGRPEVKTVADAAEVVRFYGAYGPDKLRLALQIDERAERPLPVAAWALGPSRTAVLGGGLAVGAIALGAGAAAAAAELVVPPAEPPSTGLPSTGLRAGVSGAGKVIQISGLESRPAAAARPPEMAATTGSSLLGRALTRTGTDKERAIVVSPRLDVNVTRLQLVAGGAPPLAAAVAGTEEPSPAEAKAVEKLTFPRLDPQAIAELIAMANKDHGDPVALAELGRWALSGITSQDVTGIAGALTSFAGAIHAQATAGEGAVAAGPQLPAAEPKTVVAPEAPPPGPAPAAPPPPQPAPAVAAPPLSSGSISSGLRDLAPIMPYAAPMAFGFNLADSLHSLDFSQVLSSRLRETPARDRSVEIAPLAASELVAGVEPVEDEDLTSGGFARYPRATRGSRTPHMRRTLDSLLRYLGQASRQVRKGGLVGAAQPRDIPWPIVMMMVYAGQAKEHKARQRRALRRNIGWRQPPLASSVVVITEAPKQAPELVVQDQLAQPQPARAGSVLEAKVAPSAPPPPIAVSMLDRPQVLVQPREPAIVEPPPRPPPPPPPAGTTRLEMTIVRAPPPAPPKLGAEPMTTPRARKKGDQKDQSTEPARGAQVTLQATVDAIAQKIFHRIMRRIENDLERSGRI